MSTSNLTSPPIVQDSHQRESNVQAISLSAPIPQTKGDSHASGTPRSAFAYLVYAVLIVALVTGAYFLFTGPFAKVSRAVLPLGVSASSSSLFAWPLTIPADGTTPSKIDVYLASDQGVPLTNYGVQVSASLGSVQPERVTTDSNGHAVFHVTMSEPGTSTIVVIVNDKPIGKRLTVRAD